MVHARMMGMAGKPLLTLTLVLCAGTASAQLSPHTFGGIPFWADSALRAAGLDQRFALSSELNPVYEFGDFDRDGLLDVAVEVRDKGAFRCGIAIAHRIDRSVRIVGAGHPVGNGKERTTCRGGWGVRRADHWRRHAAWGFDLLYVAERGGQGGWLIWDGRTYVFVGWDQGGA